MAGMIYMNIMKEKYYYHYSRIKFMAPNNGLILRDGLF